MHLCKNRARGHGGQISRGLWGSECMLGAGLYSLRDSQEQGRWRNKRGGSAMKGRGVGGCSSRPCGKQPPQEEEKDVQQAAGNGIKEGGCQSGLS